MAKITIHDDRDTVEQLKDELPVGEPWGQYLLECVQMRKRVEARELVLTEPDTDPLDEQ